MMPAAAASINKVVFPEQTPILVNEKAALSPQRAECESVPGALVPARGALLGISLGAGMWILLAAAILHFTK